MIIKKLSIENFGSYFNKTEVFFPQSGIFLISGPTGSGKTTILEAISFALFGIVPRYYKKTTNELKESISKNSKNIKEKKLIVELEFILNEKEYILMRTVTPKIKKDSEQIGIETKLELRTGNKVIASNHKEYEKNFIKQELKIDDQSKAYESFTKSIFLPQNQFDQILHQSTEKIKELIFSLLNLERYDKIKEKINQKFKDLKKEVEQINNPLKQIETQKANLENLIKQQNIDPQKAIEQINELKNKIQVLQENIKQIEDSEDLFSQTYQQINLKNYIRDLEEKEKEILTYQNVEKFEHKEDSMNTFLQNNSLLPEELKKAIDHLKYLSSKNINNYITVITIFGSTSEFYNFKSLFSRKKDIKEQISKREAQISKIDIELKENLTKLLKQKESEIYNKIKEIENIESTLNNLKNEKKTLEESKDSNINLKISSIVHYIINNHLEICPVCESQIKEEKLKLIKQKLKYIEQQEYQQKLSLLEKKIEEIEKEKKYKENERNDLEIKKSEINQKIENLKERLKDVQKEIQEYEENLKIINEELSKYKKLKKVDNQTKEKIKSFINSDSDTKELNETENKIKSLINITENLKLILKKNQLNNDPQENQLINNLNENIETLEKLIDKLEKTTDEENKKYFTKTIQEIEITQKQAKEIIEKYGITLKKIKTLRNLKNEYEKIQREVKGKIESLKTIVEYINEKQYLNNLIKIVTNIKEIMRIITIDQSKPLDLYSDEFFDLLSNKLKEEINIVSENIIQTYKNLQDITNLNTLKQIYTNIESLKKDFSILSKNIKDNFKNLLTKITEIIEKLEEYKKTIDEYENKRQELEEKAQKADFYKELSEIFTKFHDFIYTNIFEFLKEKANIILSDFTNGRYEISIIKEDKDSYIGIKDKWYGDIERSAKTLSGGERFLLSLSLAMAIAETLNFSKYSSKSMFIDEGFGTLDYQTLNEIIDYLYEYFNQKENKVLGIITHVEEIKDKFNYIIEVSKDKNGSKVKIYNS